MKILILLLSLVATACAPIKYAFGKWTPPENVEGKEIKKTSPEGEYVFDENGKVIWREKR